MATRPRESPARRRRSIRPPGRYSATQYNASFVGFAPVNNPAITILVVLDSPEGQHHGGLVGGPVFKRIAEQVLAYRDVPHDVPAPSDVETAKNLQAARDRIRGIGRSSEIGGGAFSGRCGEDQASRAARRPVAFGDRMRVLSVVPSLTGQSVRGVTEECSRLGLVPSLIGNGVAVEQLPAAGTQVMRGSQRDGAVWAARGDSCRYRREGTGIERNVEAAARVGKCRRLRKKPESASDETQEHHSPERKSAESAGPATWRFGRLPTTAGRRRRQRFSSRCAAKNSRD